MLPLPSGRSHPARPRQAPRLILDNASWHKAAPLCWHQFATRFLPADSPDFDPIERLWLRMKTGYFIARTPDELTERLCAALNAFPDNNPKNRRTMRGPK